VALITVFVEDRFDLARSMHIQRPKPPCMLPTLRLVAVTVSTVAFSTVSKYARNKQKKKAQFNGTVDEAIASAAVNC
jgi:hypothetical protein